MESHWLSVNVMDLYNIILGKKQQSIRVFNQSNKVLKNKKNTNIITKLKKRKLKVKNIWKFDPMDADDADDNEEDAEGAPGGDNPRNSSNNLARWEHGLNPSNEVYIEEYDEEEYEKILKEKNNKILEESKDNLEKLKQDLDKALKTTNKDEFKQKYQHFEPIIEINEEILNIEKDVDKDKKETVAIKRLK